jgi:hypothetical protein
MGGFFFVQFVIKDLMPIHLDFVRFTNFRFFKLMPPKDAILVFQFNVIKLNLGTYNILFGEYFLL